VRPWQLLLFSAAVMNGIILAALGFSGHADLLNSVLAGASLPVLISTVLLFWVDVNHVEDVLQLQKINIIGFFLKVVLLGGWAVLLIRSGVLDKVTFIVILLINFLAWHGVEAYYWRLFMAGNGQGKGENC